MRKKTELYSKEQSILEDKVFEILNLDLDNSITLYELDNDIEKQTKILELIPDIKKYYAFKNISGIRNSEKNVRPWLSIIRHLTKNKYTIFSADFSYRNKENNELIRTKKYLFLNKNT
jgi:hypothetical protein